MFNRQEINRRKFLGNISIGTAGVFGRELLKSNTKNSINNQVLPLVQG